MSAIVLPFGKSPEKSASTAPQRSLLNEAIEVCRRAAQGNLEARVVDLRGAPPDILELCHALNHLLDQTDAYVRESHASLAQVAKHRFFRRVLTRGLHGSFRRGAEIINQATQEMGARAKELSELKAAQIKLADEFERNVQTLAQVVVGAATELHASAGELTRIAEIASKEAEAGAHAAQMAFDTSTRVREEAHTLYASNQEISSQVASSRRINQDAVKGVADADRMVEGLTNAAGSIGGIVRVVREIAEQTKLLALNAAIEAARAGNAGRGFAVVAQEVKSLAGQASSATDQIAERIGELQQVTRSAVDATRGIGTAIERSSAVSNDVELAVQRQQRQTTTMGASIDEASVAAGTATSRLRTLASNAAETGRAATEVLAAAAELTRMGQSLSNEVSRFLAQVRKG